MNKTIEQLEAMLESAGFKYFDYVIYKPGIQFTNSGNIKLESITDRDIRVDVITSGFQIIEGIRKKTLDI